MPTKLHISSLILIGLFLSVGAVLLFSRTYSDVWTSRLIYPEYQTKLRLHTPLFSTGYFLPRSISKDLILKASDSPIILNHTVTVPKGVTVTIEPGTQVFANEFAMLQVEGQLITRGTSTTPVRFSTNEQNEANQVWGGVIFMPNSSGTLENTKFMNAAPGVSCLHNQAVVLKNVTSTETKYPFYDCPGT